MSIFQDDIRTSDNSPQISNNYNEKNNILKSSKIIRKSEIINTISNILQEIIEDNNQEIKKKKIFYKKQISFI